MSYAVGGFVMAPDEDRVIKEWYISNQGRAWYVITRNSMHRVVTVDQLDAWQNFTRNESVDGDLAFADPLTIEPVDEEVKSWIEVLASAVSDVRVPLTTVVAVEAMTVAIVAAVIRTVC